MRYFLLLLVSWVLMGCQSETAAPESVDAIYQNGIIWTGEAEAADAVTLVVDNGVIKFVGAERPQSYISDNIIDLNGGFVMPGLMDNHVHFLDGAATLLGVKLQDAKTQNEFTDRIRDFAQTAGKGEWILDGNWDHTNWGGELPHKDWIDKHTPDNPVFVLRIDGHMGFANSQVLKLAGITAETPDPDGGKIERDSEGEPTGVLKDNAMNAVLEIVPAPSEDVLIEKFITAQNHALSLGLTKVHIVPGYPTETNIRDIYQMIKDRGLMKIRAEVSTPIHDWENAKRAAQANGTGDETLRLGGIKGLYDGALGSGTAWFFDPYSDEPGNSGFPIDPPETFKGWMKGADAAGLPLSIHAIGDRGIDEIIAAMRDIAGADIKARRYTIEHFQHPSPNGIAALAESGIIASMQPYHAIDDGRWADERIGNMRGASTYAFRSILDAGGILTFGSDWPVATLSPMEGIYAAVTRQTLDGANPEGWYPAQKITVEEAMTAYTATNAYAFGEEDIAGTLKAGKRADFVILSNDPRAVAPEDIRNITVKATIIKGETVYGNLLP